MYKDKDGIGRMGVEQIEAYVEAATDRELDAIADGKFTPQSREFITVLPKVKKSDAVLFAVMATASGVVVYCMGMLAAPLWLPVTVDRAAYVAASEKPVPTRVTYCADSGFGGRRCTLINNQDEIQVFTIREDR